MELISGVFPSGPVKLFDFLFCFFFLPPSLPPLTLSALPLPSLSSFITAAHQELRDNQLAEPSWLSLRSAIMTAAETWGYCRGIKWILSCFIVAARSVRFYFNLLLFLAWQVMRKRRGLKCFSCLCSLLLLLLVKSFFDLMKCEDGESDTSGFDFFLWCLMVSSLLFKGFPWLYSKYKFML